MNQESIDRNMAELKRVRKSFKNLGEAVNRAKEINANLAPLLSNKEFMKQIEEQRKAFARINESTLKPMQEALNRYKEFSTEISKGFERVTEAINSGVFKRLQDMSQELAKVGKFFHKDVFQEIQILGDSALFDYPDDKNIFANIRKY